MQHTHTHTHTHTCTHTYTRTLPSRSAGEFVECLGPILQEQGMEVLMVLLQHCHSPTPASRAVLGDPKPLLTHEVLEMLCALLTHRRFSEMFVQQGGAQALLQLPR